MDGGGGVHMGSNMSSAYEVDYSVSLTWTTGPNIKQYDQSRSTTD